MKCGHCGNFAPMKKGATYSTIGPVGHEDLGTFDEGDVYEILECPSCKKINLTSTYYFEPMCDEDNPPDIEILYPADDKLPIGLPDTIKRAYEAAVRVRNIDANAYGVLVGRLLEMVCEDRKAKGKYLGPKLADLAAKGEIPNNLVGVASGLRDLRNVGAHAVLGDLTAEEIPILSNLARAILEYVYSAPHLAQMAQEKLDKLKMKRKP
jgi:hypothetical protein